MRSPREKHIFTADTQVARVENAPVIASTCLRNQGQHGLMHEKNRNIMHQTVTGRKRRAARWASSRSIYQPDKDEDECRNKKERQVKTGDIHLFLFILMQAFTAMKTWNCIVNFTHKYCCKYYFHFRIRGKRCSFWAHMRN